MCLLIGERERVFLSFSDGISQLIKDLIRDLIRAILVNNIIEWNAPPAAGGHTVTDSHTKHVACVHTRGTFCFCFDEPIKLNIKIFELSKDCISFLFI